MSAEIAIGSAELILAAFGGAIKDLRFIILTKDCDSDFKPIVVTLRNANLQVCRWGETVGLTGDEVQDLQSLENYVPKEKRLGAEETLRTIKQLTDKVKGSSGHNTEDFKWPDKETQLLCDALDQQCSFRERIPAFGKKLVHVAFRKDQVENEVRHICQLSHDLLHLYAGTKKSAMELALDDALAIGRLNAQRIVELVAKLEEKKPDEDVGKAIVLVKEHQKLSNVTFGLNQGGIQNSGTLDGRNLNITNSFGGK